MHRPLRVLVACLLLFAWNAGKAQEICNNGIDDDGDGLIDINDTADCVCSAVIGGGVSSIIPNASFEDNNCLPTSYSELNCADGWAQATWATSDYFWNGSYMPGWIPQPLPGGGNGCVGGYACPDYMEYIGACTGSPMLAGTSYTIQMSVTAAMVDNVLTNTTALNLSTMDFTIWGYPSCAAFPVNTSTCPEPEGWVALGTVPYTPNTSWNTISMTFTPSVDIQAIMLGPPCNLPADYPSVSSPYLTYLLYDNLVLNESALFGSTITDSGDFYTNDLNLTGHPDTVATYYQWYYQGVALVGQTDSILGISVNQLDTGWYQFLSGVDTACTITAFHVDAPICVTPIINNAVTSNCGPFTVDFDNGTDTVHVLSMTWDFGDGSATSSDFEPSHAYTDPGTYNVTLSLVSDDHCPTDTTRTSLIVVNAFPEAQFTADLLEGCIGMQVNFTNTTDTLTGTCAWDFGDGGGSNTCDPAYTFNTAGLFDVTLTVTSPAGCADDTTMTQYINVYSEPAVSFTQDTVAGCTPLTIAFTNTTPASQVGTVDWNFGNGQTSTDGAPSTTYDQPGTYSVYLHVVAPVGCEADTTYADLIQVYGHPVVTLTAVPDSGCYPLEVQFTNTTDATMIGTCSWHFGNGDSTNVCAPIYTYQDPGVYNVSLQVISPQNCDGDTTYADLITVFDHPHADFSFGPQPTDVFNTFIHFRDSSSVDAITWSWQFGQDGILGTSADEFPSLHFPSDDLGQYPVRLVVSNVHTCTDTALATVIINGYYSVFAPNAFTPDGDGVNDVFLPVIQDQREKLYRLSVYDRWGTKVFDSSHPHNPWIGTMMNSSGDPLPEGVYVWRLQTSSLIDSTNKEYLGHVTLLR